MGTGPACMIAAQYSTLSSLILLTPYTSLQNVVRSMFGSIPAMLVRERFENIKNITQVKCPTLIIHGLQDQVIPESHALNLY